MVYNDKELTESTLSEAKELKQITEEGKVVWLDVEGYGDLEMVRHLGAKAKLHRLMVEDIVTYQRTKIDVHLETSLLTLHSFTQEGRQEQLTLVIGQGFLLTFQEGIPGDCFGPVRQRLRENIGIVRSRGADYLAYALIDAVIDSYFPVVEAGQERLESLEDGVLTLERVGTELIDEIRLARQEISTQHRHLRPLLDCLSTLIRDVSTCREETRVYLNDCRDHVLQLLDSLEGQREMVAQLTDLYLSSLSHRMNQTMSVLTVIATIFMPLSFIAGVYGMNFNPEVSPYNMPELNWRFGYFFALGLMMVCAGGMLHFFRRRGWFSQG